MHASFNYSLLIISTLLIAVNAFIISSYPSYQTSN
ncbi:Nematode Specific Peptide family, group A [Caenorhabditis elegans]|uniref:Nematode Specific Peptide family, group A n=1 Tax=Caenorhabditis elegans TaxID=6239 RepID=A0A2K5ATY6_CAEEL|nr:Nematode Specific Peptide family, group A [Caenorhabditis elegans]SPC48645.1 Nematode Specific Peptide family, group A [Caenorhabditis elegans]|eukprot:NP_001348784.1 Uncharacterized protein CELE_C04C11.25 [Caenorhabditis elegans]